MQGGPSQLETFDPKPGHANGGETRAIHTNVPGMQLADNLPNLARVADRLAVVRSLSTREGDHLRGTFLMHTSYATTASVQYPAMGAVVAHEMRNAACELPRPRLENFQIVHRCAIRLVGHAASTRCTSFAWTRLISSRRPAV